MSELTKILKRWYDDGASELSESDIHAIVDAFAVDPRRDGQVRRSTDLEKELDRDRSTIHRWKKGEQLDPLDDRYFDGVWHDVYYVTSLQSLDALKSWADAAQRAQRLQSASGRGTRGRPLTLKERRQRSAGKGNEHIRPADLVPPIEIQLDVRGIGRCLLLYRNRGWLAVDCDGKTHKVRISEITNAADVPASGFWPYDMESMLAFTFPTGVRSTR